jgi:hypothetical protein
MHRNYLFALTFILTNFLFFIGRWKKKALDHSFYDKDLYVLESENATGNFSLRQWELANPMAGFARMQGCARSCLDTSFWFF